jgi:hypothetical protein
MFTSWTCWYIIKCIFWLAWSILILFLIFRFVSIYLYI